MPISIGKTGQQSGEELFTAASQVPEINSIQIAVFYTQRLEFIKPPAAWKASALPLSYTRISAACRVLAIAYSAVEQVSTVALRRMSALYRPCAVGKPPV
jgi:hypothetical protein